MRGALGLACLDARMLQAKAHTRAEGGRGARTPRVYKQGLLTLSHTAHPPKNSLDNSLRFAIMGFVSI